MSSSSASDRELSECSSSPRSYTLRDSPYSSPSQQVPQLVNNLTELSCTEKSFHFLNNVNQPMLNIVEQPQNHFRFRYVSEMVGTHGCLLGKSYGINKNKTHPTVELLNYTGRALIRCRLVQCDSEEEHPHKLLEDEQEAIDVSSVVPEHGSYKVSFAGMGIIHTAKKDVPGLFFKKFSEQLKGTQYDPKDLRQQCDNLAKKINLNIVRLRFSAHDIETGRGICEPVFSERIHNMKSAATNDLRICRISQYTGRPRGGEDVIILVEKVNKKNVTVKFSELDENGQELWSDNGSFMQSDVHHQYAIVCRTPPYKNPQTPVNVKVVIELVRPSDGRKSEPMKFTYKAEQVYKQIKKRKINSSYSSFDSSSGGSITDQIPTTVMMDANATAPTSNEVEVPLFTIQTLPQPAGSPSSQCGLGSALGTLINTTSPEPLTASPMWCQQPPFQTHTQTHSSIPSLKLHSSEIEEIIRDVGMTPDDRRALTEMDLTRVFGEYASSWNSLSDIQTEEQGPMDFLRASLVPDSGRVKKEPSSSSNSPVSSSTKGRPDPLRGGYDPSYNADKSSTDKLKESSEYDAYYEPADGLEVKKLVQELCEIIKNKKGHKNQEVRSKLERLFEIRLSNGDTFLHMTLCSNLPSFESIIRVIHSVKMTSLLNYGNNKQQTILHLAVIHDLPQLIPLLLAKGCNPMIKNSEEDNVIQYAVRYNKNCLEPLLAAIKKNNVQCDLNYCNGEKQTALHLAALDDCGSSCALLLRHGASHNVRDAAGRTPMHLAAYDARLHALRALLTHIPESDIDALDGSGNTALQIVCGCPPCSNTVEMVTLLLEKKADPERHEEHNKSAWRLAYDIPSVRDIMKQYVSASGLEDDVKSEPEDDFESADEDMAEAGMQELTLFVHEVSSRMDDSGAWRELARRLRTEALLNWFQNQPSPTYTLLHHIKEIREEITSKSLALILEDMGEIEAASIIRRYLD